MLLSLLVLPVAQAVDGPAAAPEPAVLHIKIPIDATGQGPTTVHVKLYKDVWQMILGHLHVIKKVLQLQIISKIPLAVVEVEVPHLVTIMVPVKGVMEKILQIVLTVKVEVAVAEEAVAVVVVAIH
ncbi:hypothetical protein A2801_02870 [Candidatus Woesebacteria bacterium RIFCSPHIGHO2_01_FULL_41_10]|uniref:Uncharacterized protein n=1 Tax=Candidatus Woesebacteria bacterium RIFCSPHIGHO2_01_FULL_41_10 TaxID=1802500 RepID=A0A1F7YPP1_9BACT|nr:MAG: hypothetical protein A2801_02870 [Candidatus Woesebacteria bacterium RIFCSPHIGHO2_01_FULL_41_10]